MYKVMLVDDDYPVLELLSNSIAWEELGLSLYGVHENGLTAYEHALLDMPDILITDIGMPKMNGIELIQHLYEMKPSLSTVILSCHSEFHYAQQAMKLNVHDYLIKDTFDPADLYKLMQQFKKSLDQEREINLKNMKTTHLVNSHKMILKRNFIRKLIHQPILHQNDWLEEAQSFKLNFNDPVCLPIIGFIDDFQLTKQRFISDDNFSFALENVIDEIIKEDASSAIHFSYGTKESFILYSFVPSLKVNIHDHVKTGIQRIQHALQKSLKVSMSFLIGGNCDSPEQLKRTLSELLFSHSQRFYLKNNEITKINETEIISEDLFQYFDQAIGEFRNMMVNQKKDELKPTISKWVNLIGDKQFPHEVVKDWFLKLLLDLKLKFHSMQHFRTTYSADTLHKEMVLIDSLEQLEKWLIHYFQNALLRVGDIMERSNRSEIIIAIDYVTSHLNERISLEDISKHLHLNSSYFSRMFRKETGETFIEFVTRIKMERAKELLDQTNYNVNQICELLGYDNQSYFIKTFKTFTGTTPIEYRGHRKDDVIPQK